MKFQKVIPKEIWTPERTQAQIDFVRSEIIIFNQEINKIDGKLSELIEQKMILRRKLSNKAKYINQLEAQLKEEHNNNL